MRTKIDYGIDLGTTNSAIARMEDGSPVIIKTDFQKDTLPSCVHFNKRKDPIVGDKAVAQMKKDSIKTQATFEKERTNTFIEFKRTMGTTTIYESAHVGKAFTSEELSAEVLKKIKTLIQDENLSSVVITVPAKFGNQQKEATMKAARLAGFKQVQLLQEPVAAATAYGLSGKSKDGYWCVFDFGGGTFDAALVKAEEGLLSVKDTDGDNWLGGKNLDEAIVDQFLIPYLQDNYEIDHIVDAPDKRQMLRAALKWFAEDAKNQLSFKPAYSILSELDELSTTNDDGEEYNLELDIEITEEELATVFSPIFQKAIDITKGLLKRNNLDGDKLDKIILVGGPTQSPILRRMLKEQITEKVDTSVDPMTVVAKGAALYASTVDVSEEVQEETRDLGKLQLEVKYEASSIETMELISVKERDGQSTASLAYPLSVEFVRADGGWSSPQSQMKTGKPILVDVVLLEGRANAFNIQVYDACSNRIACEPSQITIMQGIGGLDGMQVLPSHICLATYFEDEEKKLIMPVKGLEKNSRYPATGVINGLKTLQAIRPGMASDVIRIPIYEGDYNSQGTIPELNNLIFEVQITGEMLPALLPEGSDVDITIKVDKSGLMKFSADFPALEYTEELDIPVKAMSAPEAGDLVMQLADAKCSALRCNANDVLVELQQLEEQLENEKGSPDGRMKVLDGLRKQLLQLADLEKAQEWPDIEKELTDTYFRAEELVGKIKQHGAPDNLNLSRVESRLKDYKRKVDATIRTKNRGEAKALAKEIYWFDYNLRNFVTGNAMDVKMLQHLGNDFSAYKWKDAGKARHLITKALQQIAGGNKEVSPMLDEIVKLLDLDDPKTQGLLGGGG